MRRCAVVLVALLVQAAAARDAIAQDARDVPLADPSQARFATLEEARELLSIADRFIEAMSAFDRQCRLQSAEPVEQQQLLTFVAAQARDWKPQEIERLTPLISAVRRRLEGLQVPLPDKVLLIKTSGKEESGAAYCRGLAIVLPESILESREDAQLERLLIHELFHIVSRHSPETRRELYKIIGFEMCEPIAFPAALADRKITNPDAPLLDCVIALTQEDGSVLHATPILYADEAYQGDEKTSLFQYLQFRLLVVERDGDAWRAAEQDGQPQLLNPRSATSFLEQIGRNTNYIIHPDEILADNFTHLLMGSSDLPTPRIIEQMRGVLQ